MLLLSMGLELKQGTYNEPDNPAWHGRKVDLHALKPNNWGPPVLAGHGSVFTKYEEELKSGQRPPGPIEGFAFSTMSRRDCYRLRTLRPFLGAFVRVDLSVAD